MKNKTHFFAMFLMGCVAIATGCKKDAADDATPTPVASKSFSNLTFNTTNAYFSTNGTMSAPVDSNAAKIASTTSKIDITFIFNGSYTEPGFFDPKARSQVWYWMDYYKVWLSTAVETRYYDTGLSKAQFDAAKGDQTKIGTYFASISMAPHAIFPTGSCIGGRQTSGPTSILLTQGKVFGFKNTATGKRGLLYIRTDQYSGWPVPISNFNTKVDIIREN